jgi:hypothetical protein
MNKLLFTTGLAMGSILLFAQDKAQPPPGVVQVQTIITVEAQHDHDKAIPSLKAGDVIAYKGEEHFQVTDLVPFEGENAGLQLFLLIDDASSATLGSQLEDLRHFIETQPASTSIGIGYMRNAMVNLAQDLTTNHGDAAKAVRLPLASPGAMASPYLSLSDLIKRWPDTPNRREIIFITSGVDPMGDMGTMNAYLDSAIEAAQRHGIIVYAIYTPPVGHARHSFWRLNWAQNHLAQLAEETGGEAYMLGFGPPVSFAPYLEEIATHLAHQYRASFLMKPGDKGGLRDVRFATQVPNAALVAPSAVYVPAASEQPGK